ncbi:MAG: dihydroorotase-like protein [Gammaproteobacteria bacterium]|nr:MAG: dihydroorotase-like protein [Gammaproteobacteria bacterium]
MNTLSIVNARLLDPERARVEPGELHIADGRILAVGPAPAGFRPTRRLDAGGALLCPGLIDLSARLPAPDEGTAFGAELRAAARCGITTVAIPPEGPPVLDQAGAVRQLRDRAAEAGGARVVPIGALTHALAGERLGELGALREAGCGGVGHGLAPVPDLAVLRHALEYAATFDLTVHVVPQHHQLAAGGVAHEGLVATRLGLPGIPVAAETVAIAQVLALAEPLGLRLHLGRISSAAGLELVARAKDRGLPVTADTAVHHLWLTEDALGGYDSRALVSPPLRGRADRDALRRGLVDGTLDALCSDHHPLDDDAKREPLPEARPGLSGLDTLLGLSLALAEELQQPAARLLGALTAAPARILGLPAGRLAPGAPADLILVDDRSRSTVEPERFRSRSRHSPFAGWSLPGRIRHVLIGGHPIEPS